MKHGYSNGKIVLNGQYWECADYDVANERFSAQFDGKGGLNHYFVANKADNYAPQRIVLALGLNGEPFDAFAEKTVEMIGRTQKIVLKKDGFVLTADQFITPSYNGVFIEFAAKADKPSELDAVFYFGFGQANPHIENKGCVQTVGDLNIGSSAGGEYVRDNNAFHIRRSVNGDDSFRVFIAYDAKAAEAEKAICDFEKFRAEAREETERVELPAAVKTEEEKAFYYGTYFCALENYRKVGEFEGFSAGCTYLNPLRTYFRDGYWTTLPMYSHSVGLVRSQIKTLSRGIAGDGSCPSAVKCDFSAFWGDHYDSPSFFVMMLYDYINHTGEVSFLSEDCGGATVLGKAVKVIDKLSCYADETGLLYKQGPFNKRDWADEVNRNGYVSYDEILYIRALFCISELLRACGKTKEAEKYSDMRAKALASLNEILWDDGKGYFVNYRDGDFTEDNFSVDTLTAVIFGVCGKEQSARLLQAAEKYLDTRKNGMQAPDFGIASVFPLYKKIGSAARKSAQPFNYHNGANWPYLSAVYAYAQALCGRDYSYALTSWFDYNVKRGNYTPIEYFSPYCRDGSLLQAWSGLGAFVLDNIGKPSFFAPCKIGKSN